MCSQPVHYYVLVNSLNSTPKHIRSAGPGKDVKYIHMCTHDVLRNAHSVFNSFPFHKYSVYLTVVLCLIALP